MQRLALSLCLVIAGCGPHAARARFSNEFSCDLEHVTMTELGASSYRVTGCGRTAVYACRLNATGAGVCSLDSQGEAQEAPLERVEDVRRRHIGPSPPPRPRSTLGTASFDGQEYPALRLSAAGAILVIFPDTTTGQAFRVTLARPGGLAPPAECRSLVWMADDYRATLAASQTESGPLTFVMSEALWTALETASRVEVGVCGRTVELGTSDRTHLRELAARDQGERRQSDAPPEMVDLRAALDERRGAVVACVGRAPVGVVVTRDPEGVRITLQPPYAGSAEETCVQDVLRDLAELPAGPHARLVHAVE